MLIVGRVIQADYRFKILFIFVAIESDIDDRLIKRSSIYSRRRRYIDNDIAIEKGFGKAINIPVIYIPVLS